MAGSRSRAPSASRRWPRCRVARHPRRGPAHATRRDLGDAEPLERGGGVRVLGFEPDLWRSAEGPQAPRAVGRDVAEVALSRRAKRPDAFESNVAETASLGGSSTAPIEDFTSAFGSTCLPGASTSSYSHAQPLEMNRKPAVPLSESSEAPDRSFSRTGVRPDRRHAR